jgi:sulfur-carrier protein
MQINVKLFATFRLGRFSIELRKYRPGICIAEVISELEIPEREIGMIMLNNRHAEPERELNEGDTLSLFPLLGGG